MVVEQRLRELERIRADLQLERFVAAQRQFLEQIALLLTPAAHQAADQAAAQREVLTPVTPGAAIQRLLSL